jgi:hypothetical protein
MTDASEHKYIEEAGMQTLFSALRYDYYTTW